jgi:hypothetical protein
MLAPVATPGSLKANQFLLLGGDFYQATAPILELKSIMNSYTRIAKTRRMKPETVFQEFFEAHPEFVMRDGYSHHWSKPRLERPEGSYFEPDFVLRRRGSAHIGSMLKVLDLKLPDEPLLTGAKVHKTFSKALISAIGQIRDYGEHFSRPDLRAELQQRFGVPPEKPRLAILIGRTPNDEARERLRNQQHELRCADIEILTYDSILDDEARRLALKLRSLRLVSSSL